MDKKIILLLLLSLQVVSLIGCNTTRGVGKDVENAGESIQRTVDHND
jgi:entericidin B